MTRILAILVISGSALGLGSAPAIAEEATAYTVILGHYESIRKALLHDTTEGVSEQAGKIAQRIRVLLEEFDPDVAAVSEEKAAQCRENLPSIAEAAGRVQEAETLTAKREAFSDLSRSMIRYRQMVTQPETVVVFCSMAEKVWMQPEGEIGNPYHGQSMPRCGQIVSQ